MFPDICLFWVRSSAAELPTPEFTQDVWGILIRCRHLKLRVWGCVWETACTLPSCHTFFQNCHPEKNIYFF